MKTSLCLVGNRGHSGGYVLNSLNRFSDVELVGYATGTPEDSSDAFRRWCAANGCGAEVFDDYRQMLDSRRPDAVVVDGPFERHAEMCVAALQRGLHVFSEKPVATTFADLEQVREALAGADVVFMGMMGLRYDPAFYTAWKAVQSGAVGRVRMINARKSYQLGSRAPHYHRRATYGGTIPWIGSHAIDWMSWFSGERFRTVHAVHTTRDNAGNGEMEMSALCQFAMTSDVFASVSIDYLRPGTAPTWGDDQIRVAGTDGVIEVRHGNAFLINGATDGEEQLVTACPHTILGDFLGRVRGTDEGLIANQEALVCTEACLYALQSADEGRVVNFPAPA